MNEPVLVLHGGAGNILRGHFSEALQAEAEHVLNAALQSGYKILHQSGSAVDAVEIAIRTMEDHPLFNAGFGCVLNAEGLPELDASIMDGQTLQNGAVAGISCFAHPVSIARMVMENSPHNLLIGRGAEQFAITQGFSAIDPRDLIYPARVQQLKNVQESDRNGLPFFVDEFDSYKYGTVGAVARDNAGNLAAATSTGGMMNKKFGRVGDSAIVGAGTYANNVSCAVSCTGQGEYFMQHVVGYDLHALMNYAGMDHSAAAKFIIHEKLVRQNAQGGLISVDSNGNVAMEFNTPGMYRAFRKGDTQQIAMFNL